MSFQKSAHLSVTINRPPADVYRYVSNPENLPDWAGAFCESIDRQEGDWIMNTANGQMKIRFVDANPHGVLDHFISSPDVNIYVPMRVVANGAGSEILFTLFQMPGMSDARFGEDRTMVERDLLSLKRLLES